MATPTELIAQNFPHLAWLINDPEIGPLLLQAVDPNTGFDAATFEAKVQATSWFQQRSQTERELEIMRHTDPSTYWDKSEAFFQELSNQAALLGRPLDWNEAYFITTVALNNGLTPDSAQVKNWLQSLLRPEDVMAGKGTAGAAKNEVENLVRGQWFAPLDLNWLAWAGGAVATGVESLESINARLASQAWHWYPHLRQQITEGQTLADIMNPYRSLIAEELELGGPEAVDVTNNPEWRKLLDWRDPKTNEQRLPTMTEAMVMARSRPEWWQTQKGRQADAASAQSMLRLFGARA